MSSSSSSSSSIPATTTTTTIPAPPHSEDAAEKSVPNSTTLESSASSNQAAAQDVPDGGFQAWMTGLGSFFVMVCSAGYANSYGVYEDYLVRDFLNTHSSSKISAIGSVQILFLGALGIISGNITDLGHFRPVMLFGSFILVFSIFMTSLAQEQQYWQLLLSLGFGVGIGIGSIFVPGLAILAHHFKRRRSLMMGLVGTGVSIGGVLHPIMLNQFIHGRVGFRWGVRINAFFTLALLILANIMMTTRLPPRLADSSLRRQMRYWGTFVRDKVFVLAALGSFFSFSAVYFPMFFLQLDAVRLGVDEKLAFYALSVLNAFGVLGRFLPTIVADRVGSFNLLIISAFACGTIIFTWMAMKDIAGVMSIAVFYGFFSGAVVSLVGPMVAYLTVDVSQIGARLGLVLGAGSFGALYGAPISGLLLTSKYTWIRPVIFNGIGCYAAAVFWILAKILHDRRKAKSAAAAISQGK